MSRLDSFIRRMSAQRDILNGLAPLLGDVPGLVLEFGYGSGRTHDHLRELLPERRIIVFDRVAGLERGRVAPDDVWIGELTDVAAVLPDGCAALVHADIQTGVEAEDATLDAWLPALMARLLAPGGYAVSGSPLLDPRLAPWPSPPGIAADRYHTARRL